MTKSLWIGPLSRDYYVGDFDFLIQIDHPQRDARYELRDTPAITNQSLQPTLHGWCGSYNDTSTFGCGVVEVVRVARNGRLFVRELEGEALSAALEELGYPELDPAKSVT
jgi:hypothetical protein